MYGHVCRHAFRRVFKQCMDMCVPGWDGRQCHTDRVLFQDAIPLAVCGHVSGMCTGMCTGTFVDMCIAVCTDMCVDAGIDMSTHTSILRFCLDS